MTSGNERDFRKWLTYHQKWITWIDWMLLNVPCSVSRTRHCLVRIWMIPHTLLVLRMMYDEYWGLFPQLSRAREGPWKGNQWQRWQLFPEANRSCPDVHKPRPTTLVLTRHVIVLVCKKELTIIIPSGFFSEFDLLLPVRLYQMLVEQKFQFPGPTS